MVLRTSFIKTQRLKSHTQFTATSRRHVCGIVLPKSSPWESTPNGGIAAALGTRSPKVREAAAAPAIAAVGAARLSSAHSSRCAECDLHEATHFWRQREKHRPPKAALSPGPAMGSLSPSVGASLLLLLVVADAVAVAQRVAHRWTHPVEQSVAVGAVLCAQSSPPYPSAHRHVPSWHSPWPAHPIRHARASQWAPT